MRFVARVMAMGLMVALASPARAQQGGGGHGGGPGGGGGGGPGGSASGSNGGRGGPGGPSGGSPGSGQGNAPSGLPGNAAVPGFAAPDASSPGFALGPGPGSAEADAVRDAVASGQSVPFSQVLAAVGNAMAGQIVGVNVVRRPTIGLVYTVKVLTDEGSLRQITVDARTGAVMAVR